MARGRSLASATAVFVLALVAVSLPARAQRRPVPREPRPVDARLAPQTSENGYVGAEGCRSCHRAELTAFHSTTHAGVVVDSPSQRMDCETCHGPGKAHVDGEQSARGDDALIAAASRLIFGFHGTPQQNTARCLVCHITSRGQEQFGHSRHAAAALSCQSCHATHLVEAARPSSIEKPPLTLEQFFSVPRLETSQRWLRESLLKESQPALCFQCHARTRSQFAQPFHHRVPEGSMKCTDCHGAHGSSNAVAMSAPGWETCTTCHREKHGPFLFEHPPAPIEGCAVCHTPHGSVSRFLLVRRESRFLCLQCHGERQSSQASVPHGRLGFQTRGDCTRCHVAIHGSNVNSAFLQ
jgi:predicted CXXCH cytochrome family protein